MELEFKTINKKQIDIYAVKGKDKHKVGHIFTPSGSGENTKNAIQICGFTEAFDLWGCALFQIPKTNKQGDEYIINKRSGEKEYEQSKDIQLLFDFETRAGGIQHCGIDCPKCFNVPCTCEINVKGDNPYTVKREQDLYIEKKK